MGLEAAAKNAGLRAGILRGRGLAARRRAKRPPRELGLVVLVLAVLTACGIRPTDPIPGLEAPSGPVENTSPSVYWVAAGKLVRVSRPQGSLSGYDVISLLAQGPDNAEQSRGLTTEVPFDAAPATIDRVANGLDVTISSDVSQLSGVAVQQIVCTLLGVQPVGSVNLRGGGHSLELQKCA
ncbi:GerMN domain-containing protein [Lentzea sp. NPDC054927]